jgi:hypothetical protein
MNSAEWRQAWTSPVLHLPHFDPRLSDTTNTFLFTFGMPLNVVFEWQNSSEVSFEPMRKPLVPYNSLVRWGDFYNESSDRDWGSQLQIAVEDFCNGSASYCVDTRTDAVSRIDCELPDPKCLVNSTVDQFGLTLRAATEWSGGYKTCEERSLSESLDCLAERLKAIDGSAWDTQGGFWRDFVDCLREAEEKGIEITDDPMKSKPRF